MFQRPNCRAAQFAVFLHVWILQMVTVLLAGIFDLLVFILNHLADLDMAQFPANLFDRRTSRNNVPQPQSARMAIHPEFLDANAAPNRHQIVQNLKQQKESRSISQEALTATPNRASPSRSSDAKTPETDDSDRIIPSFYREIENPQATQANATLVERTNEIKLCAPMKNWQRVLQIINDLDTRRIAMDGICFNSAISVCASAGRPREATMLLDKGFFYQVTTKQLNWCILLRLFNFLCFLKNSSFP